MILNKIYSPQTLSKKALALFAEQRRLKRLDGWFLAQEIRMKYEKRFSNLHPEIKAAAMLEKIVEELPLSISDNAVFAGTQNDSFTKSYALINPEFRVETFEGYCDPAAVFNDIETNSEFTRARIEKVKQYILATPYVKSLRAVYKKCERETREVAYFVEQVTGHTIADFRPILHNGIQKVIIRIDEKNKKADSNRKANYEAMKRALLCAVVLSDRYARLARKMALSASRSRQKELEQMAETLSHVPRHGARNLFEAVQSFMILWQVMCLEQSPNPFAFSAGNVDRIFEPFRSMDHLDRKTTASLFKHLLVFFNVGDRSWAISQNLLVGGKSSSGRDLTSECTLAFLDAFYECNYPQPILSVKVHRNTPSKLYAELGRFFFTPGCLTPSFFNDDSLFPLLGKRGVEKKDLEDYSVAGCQEPLIMGKDNGNTTNSWLNLAKILELTLHNGKSALTGKKIGPSCQDLGFKVKDPFHLFKNIRPLFYKNLTHYAEKMVISANGCSSALSHLSVPLLSACMGGTESGIDVRDSLIQGTRYNASGCLIHGLSVIADSFIAVDNLIKERPEDASRLLKALRMNFKNQEGLRQFLASCEKYGNNSSSVDHEARQIAARVSELMASKKNYLGNPFRPDFSSPSTHLLYGYWVAATPDGRRAREMLGYGLDPLYGEANSGIYFRINSLKKLPFEKFSGGYASHFGINPKYFPEKTLTEKGLAFKSKVLDPLFFCNGSAVGPYYLYVNVTTPDTLKKVLADPKKYAPSGIYIMRIHGTFVNFLDLSPAIQKDIIARLDLGSTALS